MGRVRLIAPVCFTVLGASGACGSTAQVCWTNNQTLLSHGSSLLAVSVERIRTLGSGGPRKITRGGKTGTKSRVGGVGQDKGGTIWSNTNHSLLPCSQSVFAPGYDRCPEDCPFSSLDPQTPCSWRCVQKAECGKDDPDQLIADDERKICRDCILIGCQQCEKMKDFCLKCKPGFVLKNGMCVSGAQIVWTILFVVLGIATVILLLWYMTLLIGKCVDPLTLKQAVVHRSRAVLRDRRGGGEEWFPLLSNLWKLPSNGEAPVGGPGLMLLFSFQLFIIVWIVLTILAWLGASYFLGWEMLVVGTYLVVDAMDMCQAVHWGRAVRDKLRVGKAIFTGSLYLCSFFLSIAFAVWQYRRFKQADANTSTMQDYAAVCSGFPTDNGADVEEDIQAYILQATGCRTVGVSVCWDFSEQETKVLTLVTNEVRRREAECHDDPSFGTHQVQLHQRALQRDRVMTLRTSAIMRSPLGSIFHFVDALFGMPSNEGYEDNTGDPEEDRKLAEDLIKEVPASGTAFVIFQTEHDRDVAITALSAPLAPLYKGKHVIRAKKGFFEPQAICWSNFAVTPAQVFRRMAFGVFITLVAIILWGVCFYAPYAYFEAETFVATGEPPGMISELTFSMLVVIGNQIMYFLCSSISERVGFRSRDHAQVAYVLLYTGAVMVNTVVDIAIIVFTTYLNMISRKVRTDDGTLLADLPTSTAVFESYPMMKVFGRTLWEYNYSCYLLPFVMEALLTVAVPYHVGYRIIRTRSLSRGNAESYFHPIMMDLSRYGDLIVNVTLCTMCFYTASGWVMKQFVGLLVGNLFVIAFDQYRVLRHVENFYMASGGTDAVAQKLLSLPCAVLASALVFQLHGIFPDMWMVKQQNLWIVLMEAFLLHVVLHLLVTAWAVKAFGQVQHDATDVDYSEMAKDWPGNWFTSNPHHCLRSLHLHKHATPCVYYIKGKESYLEVNEALGNHYKPQHPVVPPKPRGITKP